MSLLRLICIFFIISAIASGQENIGSLATVSKSDTLDKKKLRKVIAVESAVYVSSLTLLGNMWYNKDDLTGFHFFNDNNEWLQSDKFGHATCSYALGYYGINLLKWSGVESRKAALYGGFLGSIYLLNIEMFDGFSKDWGFSAGDITANILGSGLACSQELLWQEQRIMLKYSYHNTHYSEFRPELLGNNYSQRIVKDYNGQTYWLSLNIFSLLNKNYQIPKWLNLAIGYGAEGMTGGFRNIESKDNNIVPDYTRYRKLFLSIDIDLRQFKTKYKLVNKLFDIISVLKFPFPTIEYNSKGQYAFYPVYF